MRGGKSPYDDAVNAARFAPASWVAAVTTFGLRQLLERLQAGDRPPVADHAEAVADVGTVVAEANRRAPPADRAAIQALAQQVLTALGG